MGWFSFLTPLVKPVSDAYKSRQERKAKVEAAKIDRDVAKIEAEARTFREGTAQTHEYDMQAMKNMNLTWKDDFILVIWFTPIIMLFIPGLQGYALTGFKNMAQVPWGYWLVIFGIVASTFGLKWLFQNKVVKAIKSIKEGPTAALKQVVST